jgi:hypothetical protein
MRLDQVPRLCHRRSPFVGCLLCLDTGVAYLLKPDTSLSAPTVADTVRPIYCEGRSAALSESRDLGRPTIEPEKLLLDAANRTLRGFDTKGSFAVKLTENVLKLCGPGVIGHLDSEDQGGLFLPIDVRVGNRWESDCVLTLQDRVVIAWFTGTVRTKSFELVIPYEGVREVSEVAVEAKTWRQPERVTIGIEGSVPATIKVVRPGQGWDFPRLLQDALLNKAVTEGSTD